MTLAHKEPDRVPIDFGWDPVGIAYSAYKNLKKYLTMEWMDEKRDDFLFTIVNPDERILQKFNCDFRRVGLKKMKKLKLENQPDRMLRSEWGIPLKKIGDYNEMVDHPLCNITDVKEVDEYPWWPDPKSYSTEGLKDKAEELESAGWAVVADAPTCGGVFDVAWWLRGFEKFMMDLYERPKIACAIMDKILEVQINLYDKLLSAVGDHIQIVYGSGQDLGMQDGMIISPEMYRKYIKPRNKELFDFIHSKTKAKLLYHSCGSIVPVIDDLIEIGVDILNPLQPLAAGMDSKILKQKYGDRLCFHGGIDTQKVLLSENVEDIETEVRKRIKDYAPGGGYILAPSHNIQGDVEPKNVVTLFQAAERYGKYPINL